MGVHFYLKSICGELFFSNRTIYYFWIFAFKIRWEVNKEHLLYIFTFFSSRIYILHLYGTVTLVHHP